ncbi:MAG: ATP-binding cassette domain-containing protein [Deltaproteobacteria bacterium]|jgi:oligopeptide/dipeptide ABC transporter ATP-binding protein|nr:ATP-binding cassette domain-containing protein [Deltaproteobacteria bacterium]MBT4642084.1 ATP-binding cassette domain-containing protein [Deltaproteobacteria bacterium]MBT6499097.1 ATP-binding cassette domain-containing protein [Deltaproteobacteria bacterium]MBT7155310.1 ATP-binding cassette domain-containing protein [Deltaproteobacteria bacterium]MBT7710131.1 ATP-binding cassette domain-containing protein [Deltaproteobacteria bacterium]
MTTKPILETTDLCKYFPVKADGKSATLKAVDQANLKIYPGKTLGLVGESGSGKSTIGFTMVQLHEPTSGRILYEGKQVAGLKGRDLKAFRRHVQMIFQDPYSSLDPRQVLKTIVERPLIINSKLNAAERLDKVVDILKKVGLDADQLYRYPHEFSGGQRQRIAVARALAVNPSLIVCDEPVSALDVSIQAQILNLFKDLQKELNLAYLFISHDLNVVRHISHEVAVIYMGVIVEISPTDELYEKPAHPYTKALLDSMPGLAGRDNKLRLVGEIGSPIDPPVGCRLASRCPVAQEKCSQVTPELREISPGHKVACILA